MSRFTYSDLNKLAARGMRISIQPRPKNRIIIPRKKSKELDWMHWNLAYFCNVHALQLETEYRFHNKRFWRFDFAIPALMLGIEYNGLVSEKSRHTTIKGYTGDMEKINAAQKFGYRVLQYTVLDYKTVLQDLREIILSK